MKHDKKSEVRIKPFCTPGEIRSYIFDEAFLGDAQYNAIITKRESLERIAASPDTNVVLALTGNNHIIGLGILDYPEAGERWIHLGSGTMVEVKVIEVCRTWRSSAIAGRILNEIVSVPGVERKIVYMVGLSWTWDLNNTNLSAQDYRQILIRLFGSHGFKEYETNEPNVCLRAENLFMCRVGKEVSKERTDQFNWLRFGVKPDRH